MTQSDQSATRYLIHFQSALQRYRVPQAEEIVADLQNHISEALSSGKSHSEVINALGPFDQLARSYAVELLVNFPRNTQVTLASRYLRIASFVIAGSVLSLGIVVTLGLVGVTLLAAGPSLVVGGILQWLGEHPWWINTGNLPPLAVISLGPIASVAGWGVCWVLWRYILMTARTVRRILPVPYPA
jgi:uncharacterized membrane protein